MNRMSVRKLASRDSKPGEDVVDACLALGLANIELFLAKEFDCTSAATGAPIGECITAKASRFGANDQDKDRMWRFLTVAGVPDIAIECDPSSADMLALMRLSQTKDAQSFRQWFHDNEKLDDKELLAAYIDVLHETQWTQTKTGRAIRIALSTGLGFIGLGGAAETAINIGASIVDNFVVDKVARSNGVKFFVQDFRNFNLKRR